MKRILTLFVLLISISAFSASKSTFKIGSYNLWMSHLGKGDNSWEFRKMRLAKSIADIDFDIFGAQEVDTVMQRELPDLIKQAGGAEYAWFIFSPYEEDGGVGNKAQAIIYKKDRFELVRSNHFWFSETPDVQSTGWDEMRYFRGACCAVFRDLKTGVEFFVMHTHMPLGTEAKNNAAKIIVSKYAEYNQENLPSFLLGDMNSVPDSKPSETFRKCWNDVYLELPCKKIEGPYGTFNAANLKRNMKAARRIDYIYYNGNVKVRRYTCNVDLYDGFYPSDHCPIYADVVIGMSLKD